MNIANNNGNFECDSWNEIENLIRQGSQNPFDDIWLSGNDEYPCLSILVNDKYACIHYFLNDQGDMWQSVGYGDMNIEFMSNNDYSTLAHMPANAVVSLETALECARQFYEIGNQPNSIEWREL